ncbi:MAG: hypothetical protein K0S04_34 [Herbinix sp.]|jgi:hypothetical protein|nr:hypothetical protein [Herbinix sp.]
MRETESTEQNENKIIFQIGVINTVANKTMSQHTGSCIANQKNPRNSWFDFKSNHLILGFFCSLYHGELINRN